MRRLLIVVGFILFSGCDSELKLVVLTPSQVATAFNRNYKFDVSAGVSCAKKRDKIGCYDSYGVSPDAEGMHRSQSGYFTRMLMVSTNYSVLLRQAAAANVSIAFTAAWSSST
jgi:hypothetical protein